MPNFDLSGRVAIVTGGSRHIGKAIALALAEAGADVAIAARTPEPIAAACKELEALGRRTLGVTADVTKQADVERMVAEVHRAFGRVDILVNNAGGGGRGAPLLGLTEEDFDRAVAANIKSTFFCAKAAAPIMMAQGRGAIVNVGSSMGKPPENTRFGRGAYGAAKAGVESLTGSMAAEWGPAIRVNCIVPYWVPPAGNLAGLPPEQLAARNAAFAMGRYGTPEDMAGAVVFLASDASSWITGAIVDIGGGQLSPHEAIRRIIGG